MITADCIIEPISGAAAPPKGGILKREFTAVLLIVTLIGLSLPARPQAPAPKLGNSSVEEVIRAMTLEEKARLLVGMGMEIDQPGLPALDPEDKAVPEKVPGAAGRTHGIPRLGIPSLTLSDGPAGVRIDPIRKGDSRTFYATAFPVATLLASSWDVDLVRDVGMAFGNEVRDYGIDILLAPGMNVHRNPLGGRNFEYYSEDPLVSGKMAAAFVLGVQSKGVGTSIKHLAANNQEFNRMQSNTVVSERALREIYLKGFEIAVKDSKPWTVMSSYNLINGNYTSQSPELLTTILRNEWKFEGFVMSDWFAGNDPVAQISAGNDLIMPGYPQQAEAIVAAVRDGRLEIERLNESVRRVLELVLRSPTFRGETASSQPDLESAARIARDAAAQGLVLLKNKGNALPFTPSMKIALFGNSSFELFSGGTGSGNVNKAYSVSLYQGLEAASYRLDTSQKALYLKHIADEKADRPEVPSFLPPAPIAEMPVRAETIGEQAARSDFAVITIGRNSGEFSDREVEDDFTLSDAEQRLIKTVADAFHKAGKKVVVVMNVGGVVEVASWRDRVDAILLAWQPGQEGGNAIADVLGGKVTPSGKLATTFPVAYEDVPSAKNFPGVILAGRKNLIDSPFAGKPSEVIYEEGIFVGYRYYSTFGIRPAYEFGYGLSYTKFEYGVMKLSQSRFKGKVKASVTIKNTGRFPGKEVVQLYVSAPGKKLYKPESELRGFAKTRLLQPGQSQTISFSLTAADLASFDTGSSSWLAEAGTYEVRVGASSLDTKRSADFEVEKEILAGKTNAAMAPQVRINELIVRRR